MKTRSPTRSEKKADTGKSKRLSPDVRRAQMLDTAARMIVEQGYLPLPVEELARQAGASKALIYAYFPTQHNLFNSLLGREIRSLLLGGLDTASQVRDLEQAAVLCAMLYFEHVARNGPLLNILMTDLYMAGHLDPEVRRTCDVIAERLTNLAADQLPCTREEIYAAIEMMTAIPDEAGRLVFHRELDQTTARQICHSLIGSCLKALRAPEKVVVPD